MLQSLDLVILKAAFMILMPQNSQHPDADEDSIPDELNITTDLIERVKFENDKLFSLPSMKGPGEL